MTNLEKRRSKVERLTRQALQDKQVHKYIQGRFILDEINKRISIMQRNFIDHLNAIR